AVYWASQGLEFATGPERLMCRRGVYQPLILSVLKGRFTGDLAQTRWQTASNLNLALTTADYLAETYKEYPSQTLQNVYIQYLIIAIRMFHQDRDYRHADDLYQRLLLVLPPDQRQRPTIDDIIKGWGMSMNGQLRKRIESGVD
ncbi:MAG: hypothetical protein PHV28_11885, partial [Kiritimatiellae bacterium]|nr:hypothetical protein [Kiritimatiellia bacterium]